MKYLITESKLYNTVSMYLDNQDFIVYDNKKKFDNYIYFLNNESDLYAQISVYHINSFGFVRNWVYVNYDLIKELSDFFSIDDLDCLEIIKVWVSDTLGIKVGKIENTINSGSSHRLIVKTE